MEKQSEENNLYDSVFTSNIPGQQQASITRVIADNIRSVFSQTHHFIYYVPYESLAFNIPPWNDMKETTSTLTNKKRKELILKVKCKSICLKVCIAYDMLTTTNFFALMDDEEAIDYSYMSIVNQRIYLEMKRTCVDEVVSIIGLMDSNEPRQFSQWIHHQALYPSNTEMKLIGSILNEYKIDDDAFSANISHYDLITIKTLRELYDSY